MTCKHVLEVCEECGLPLGKIMPDPVGGLHKLIGRTCWVQWMTREHEMTFLSLLGSQIKILDVDLPLIYVCNPFCFTTIHVWINANTIKKLEPYPHEER